MSLNNGRQTGFNCMYFDQVMPGELTLVTGVPNSGKSEWIDALLCNLNESVGWKFALCSMENNVSQFLFGCVLTCTLLMLVVVITLLCACSFKHGLIVMKLK